METFDTDYKRRTWKVRLNFSGRVRSVSKMWKWCDCRCCWGSIIMIFSIYIYFTSLICFCLFCFCNRWPLWFFRTRGFSWNNPPPNLTVAWPAPGFKVWCWLNDRIEISSQHVFLYCPVFYELSLDLNKRNLHLLMGCGISSQYCALYPR